jgi:hypothetical protein
LLINDSTATATGSGGYAIRTDHSIWMAQNVDLYLSAATSVSIMSDSIVIQPDAAVRATTNNDQVFGAAPSMGQDVGLTLLYQTVSVGPVENVTNVYAVEIGNITFPVDIEWMLDFALRDGSQEKVFPLDSHYIKRLFVVVGGPGEYSLTGWCDVAIGYVVNDLDGSQTFVANGTLFVKDATFVIAALQPTSPPTEPPSATAWSTPTVSMASPYSQTATAQSRSHVPTETPEQTASPGLSQSMKVIIAVSVVGGVLVIGLVVLAVLVWRGVVFRRPAARDEMSVLSDKLLNDAQFYDA